MAGVFLAPALKPATSRSSNRVLLLNLIRANEPVSRTRLATLSRLSAPAVGAIVQELIAAGAVCELGQESPARVGRRAVSLGLIPEARCVLGVRLQRGFLRLALVDLRNRILALEDHALDTADPERVVALIAERLEPLTRTAGITDDRVVAVSVASPGLVDSGSGRVKLSVNLGWAEVPLGAKLTACLSRPVHVENNANAAALAQKTCGPGKDCANLVYLTLGVGISAGVIVDHRIYGGARGYAGEIGHQTMTLEGGPLCRCGKRGCLEAYCGVEAVVARCQAACAKQGRPAPVDFAEVVRGTATSDPILRLAVTETGRILGVALANLIDLVHPELVVLGGELTKLGEPFLDSVRASVAAHTLPALLPDVRIIASTLTEDPSLTGAVALALDELFAQDVGGAGSPEGGRGLVG